MKIRENRKNEHCFFFQPCGSDDLHGNFLIVFPAKLLPLIVPGSWAIKRKRE